MAASSGGFMEPSLGGNSQGCFNSLWASLGLVHRLSCWGWEAGGTSSCPPALVSPALTSCSTHRGCECHSSGWGTQEPGKPVSKGRGPGPRDGPWVSSSGPSRGLPHTYHGQSGYF